MVLVLAIPWVAVVAGALATATFVLGIYVGAKVRGAIPLRIPTNAVRLEDAKTDVEIDQILQQRAQIRFETRALEIQGEAGLRVLEAEHGSNGTPEVAVDDQQIGDVVRTARARAGLNQLELAQKTGLSRTVIAQIESGLGARGSELRRIADVLGLVYVPAYLASKAGTVLPRAALTEGTA